MPDPPDDAIFVEEIETTVVNEFRHDADNSATLNSGSGDLGSSGGIAAATPDSILVVDGGTGAVVGEALHNPETGVYDYIDPETTVVNEPSHNDLRTDHAPTQNAVPTEQPAQNPETGSAGQGEPTAGKTFIINPEAFHFAPDGVNWQKTPCVPIIFAYGSPFMTPMKFTVGVQVGAPRTLRDGRPLHAREAQLDAPTQAAASTIIGLLDEGAIDPSEIQPRFVGYMGGAILSTGLGYRVTGCHPG